MGRRMTERLDCWKYGRVRKWAGGQAVEDGGW